MSRRGDEHKRAEGGFDGLDRRAFLATSGKLTFWGLVAAATGLRPAPAAAEEGMPKEPTPGFPVGAVTNEQQVIAAIIDTVLPAASSDPSGAAGAPEAGALNLSFDRYYPLRDFIPAIVLLVDGQARQTHGKAFAELDREPREALLAEVQESLPFLRHAYRFIRSVYYAALHGDVGSKALGFPGPNLGYVDHPDFSFRKPMSQELTSDGYLP